MTASTLIQEAMADIYASDLGVDALYRPADGSAPYIVRAVRRIARDFGGSLLSTGVSIEGIEVSLLIADVPVPKKGDKIALSFPDDANQWDDDAFWQSETVATLRKAQRDPHRLFWRLDLDKDPE